MPVDYEPFAPQQRADPYPLYRALRERDPVHWAPESGVFCVSRHEDVACVLKHPELFSSAAMQSVLMNADLGPLRPRTVRVLLGFLLRTRISPFRMQRRGSLVSIDPPRHDAMRSIVNRGFTPRRIAAWEPRARQIVSEQLRGLVPGEPFDVIEDLAVPLPVTLIAEMLGVEPRRRRDFKRWSDAVIAVASGGARENPIDSGLLDQFTELFAYLRGVVRERRREPADDLVSVLVDPAQEGVLDTLDVVNFVVLLMVAGNETTTNLIGNAAHALLEHPDQLERVARDPALVPGLVEETLRFDAPIQLVFRTATRDLELRGTRIPRGSVVVPMLGSANRDERVFDDPDRFDVSRQPRHHLGFGLGVHFCLGSSLARLEARVALEALAPELAERKLTGDPIEWIDSFLVRGRKHLRLA